MSSSEMSILTFTADRRAFEHSKLNSDYKISPLVHCHVISGNAVVNHIVTFDLTSKITITKINGKHVYMAAGNTERTRLILTRSWTLCSFLTSEN